MARPSRDGCGAVSASSWSGDTPSTLAQGAPSALGALATGLRRADGEGPAPLHGLPAPFVCQVRPSRGPGCLEEEITCALCSQDVHVSTGA